MELRHLRYFVAVADYGGITHAAERLNIAQPAVSRQIRDLEAELGVELLVREGRRVILSDAGRAFAIRARAVLAASSDAADEARRISRGEAGHLRIGLLESASWSGHLPLALNRFARTYPDVRMEVVPMGSVEQIDAVLAEELDAGFVYRQENLVVDALSILPLRVDSVMLAASADLDFGKEGALDLDDIDGLPIVSFPRAVAPAYHDALHAALAGIGFDPVIVQEAENETTMLSLVSAGVGCAFVNSANTHRPPRQVRFHKVKGLSVPIEFLFVTRNSVQGLTKRLRTIVEEVDA
ncbi:LysR family transcriptional regulator [Tateyamaria omphalii]|uniref:LysR substrate-binding domain-containing protein n=1 Tax=Tateyamaria omphalii TaxID=299262 RepID=UPI0016727FDD|nr:LysR family transcriptional regulator [Tateyamaria omphalii]GGX47393.1 LysR family transcriptional regulator [Tateyamaria omphalii]